MKALYMVLLLLAASFSLHSQTPLEVCILNEDGDIINLSNLEFNGSCVDPYNLNTNGCYEFDTAALVAGCTISPYDNSNSLNGVSTFDMVLIARHILGVTALSSPYKIIAADVNQTGTVTTLDMVLLRRLILYIDTAYTNNTSWRFIDDSYVFPDPLNPFSSALPEVATVNTPTPTGNAISFVAVKVGDVNESAVPFTGDQISENRSADKLSVYTEDLNLTAGQSYDIPIRTHEMNQLLGFQLGLDYNTKALAIEELTPSDQLEGMNAASLINKPKEGLIGTSWNTAYPQTLKKGNSLFTIRLKALKSGKLSDWLTLSEDYIHAEIYREDASQLEGIVLHDLQLAIENQAISTAPTKTFTELYQNQPNPAKNQTQIGFYLPKANTLNLQILNSNGQLVQRINGSYDQGTHHIQLDLSNLPAGLYYYQLQTATETISRKMMITP